MKEIDVEDAVEVAGAQATYDDLMRVMALQLQSTDVLVEELVRQKNKVVVLDNLSTGNLNNLKLVKKYFYFH